MARKKKRSGRGLGHKEAQVLHLKEFSQGKPNELSLNVLEQKAAAQDEPSRGAKWRLPSFRKGASTAGGKEKNLTAEKATKRNSAEVKPQPSERKTFLGADSQAEIARRKQRRRWYRRFSIALVAGVCIGAIGVGGYWAYQQYERLNTSVGVLREACELVKQSDETTVAIDKYFQDTFGDDTVSRAQELSAAIPDAKDQLESARVYAQKAESELDGSQRDKEAGETGPSP